jgi:glycosyltransferase involved in cell wall biosynthesis
MRGLLFAKQFPNPAEPLRGLFVVEQLRATASEVSWRVIAPVPYVPRWLAGPLGKPWVRGGGLFEGVPVARPRYPVLPRRILYTTVAPAMSRAARESFARAAREHQPAFVHVHDLYPSGAAARPLARAAGLPYVVTVHGSDLYSNLVRPAWRSALAEVVADASAVVCVSRALARDAVAEIGADPARTVVVPDTYDAERFTFIERPPSMGPLTLVSVGRLVPVKGFDLLVRALARAVAEGVDARLVLIGAGPEESRLRSLAEGLGLAERLRLAGAVTPDEMVEHLARADAFVSASRREGFGVAIVEALATGLPVLATRVGGPEDIVTVDDGVLVAGDDVDALAEGIAALAARIDAYDRRSIARRAFERFGPATVAAALLDVYQAVVDGRPVAPARGDVAPAPHGPGGPSGE